MCNRKTLFLCIILTGNCAVAMDVTPAGTISQSLLQPASSITSTDLSQSTLWAVQSIHAPDVFQQFGVSHPASQWYLLDDGTVQDMLKNVEQKVGNSPLSDRLQLSCLVAHDLKKLPSDDEKKQKNIFTNFLKMCLPRQMLRDLNRGHLEKIEATTVVPFMQYVFDALKQEHEEKELELKSRGFIIRLQKLIQADGKVTTPAAQKKLEQIRKRINSTAPSKPAADIMALATTVLSHAPEASAETPAGLVSPVFNPTDSVFLPQDVRHAANLLNYLKERQETLEKEIASVQGVLSAMNTTLSTPEIQDTTFVRGHLEELLQQKLTKRYELQDQLEAYLSARTKVQQQVNVVDEKLTSRQKERNDALLHVNEQIRIATSKLTQTEQFLGHAQTLKVSQSLQLQKLHEQREEIIKAQERLAPGFQAVAEFKSMIQ